jgi:site-specific recombinase XerD
MADLSRWLGESRLEPAELSSARLERFLADRRAKGGVFALTTRGVAPLLGYLRRLGVVPEATMPEPEGPVDCLLEEFVAYLVNERGLAWETIVGYRRVARAFLVSGAPDVTSPACGVELLGAGEINAFVLSECAQRSTGSAGNVVKALRALLGFIYFHGYTDVSLVDCVPKAASWRETGRSRALEPDQVRRLLASCDRRSAAGRRDFAIRHYAASRDELCPRPKDSTFFLTARGTRLPPSSVHCVFNQLVEAVGLEPQPDAGRPRIHGLRHYVDGEVMCPVGVFPLVAAVPVMILSA